MTSRRITVGVIAAGCLLAVGCSAKDSPGSSSVKATGSVVAVASAGSTGPSPSPPAPSSTAPAQPAKASAPCSLLTKPQAAQVLGGAVIKTRPGAATAGGAGMKKIDGCYYKAAKTSVSYAVLELGPISPSEAIAAARGRMPRDSTLKQFEPGLGDQSLGVTGAMGTGAVAIVHIAKGDRLSSVTAAGKSTAEAKQIALDTATILIGG